MPRPAGRSVSGVAARPARDRNPALWGLGAAVLLSRAPWLGVGYGNDPDASRVVLAARAMLEERGYVRSRPPGYPVHESLVALLQSGGPWLTNGLSAVAAAVAAVLLARIARRLGSAHPVAVGAALAFTPVVFVASTSTMDYTTGLALALGAVDAVLAGRSALGGVLLGLAIGARVTYGALLLPLALWTLTGEDARRRALVLAGAALATGALCFLPVVARYGPGFFTFADNVRYPAWATIAVGLGPGVWGTLGTVALLAAIVSVSASSGHVRDRWAKRGVRRATGLAALTVALYVVAYLRLPHTSAYLVPVVPFALLVAGLLLPARALLALCVAVGAASFVGVGRSGLAAGPALADRAARVAGVAEVDRWREAVRTLPRGSVLVAGYRMPELEVALGTAGGGVELRYLVESEAECRDLAASGRPMLHLPGMDAFNLEVRGVRLTACGSRMLVPGGGAR